MPTRVLPARSSGASASDGARTFSTRSQPQAPAASVISAPAAAKPASVTLAARPAPDCTRMVCPCALSFLTVSGVAATRVSPGSVSAGTPISMSSFRAQETSCCVFLLTASLHEEAAAFSTVVPKRRRPCDSLLCACARNRRKKTRCRGSGLHWGAQARSVHDLLQLAGRVARGHLLQGAPLDLGALAFAAELQVALLADGLGSLARGLHPLAHVELVRVLGLELAHRAGHGQADVGVDVDLAHAVLDGFLDLGHRHAVGFLHLAAVLVDEGQQLLRHAGGAVHDQVRVGNARVDLLDALD